MEILSLQNIIINGLTVQVGEQLYKGRDCFPILCNTLENYLIELAEKHPEAEDIVIIDNAFQRFTDTYQSEFGHYFRSLHNILRVIDEANIGVTNDNKPYPMSYEKEERRKYAHTLRAQLSTFELILLYYHCTWNPEEKHFKTLIEKYTMLDNLDTAILPFPGGRETDPAEPRFRKRKQRLYASSAFGMNKQNRIARITLN